MEKTVLSQHRDLPQSVQELARILESLPAGITVTDLGGRILYLNRRNLNALGYPLEELQGKNIEILYRDSLSPEQRETIKQATMGPGWKGEILNYRKDGSSFPVYLETSVIPGRGDEPAVAVAVARDITEQRAFQERLLVEAKLGTLGLITQNVAHEVRNRLSAIRMSLYMLEQDCQHIENQGVHFSIAKEEMDRVELFLRTLEGYANPPKASFAAYRLTDVVDKGVEDARPVLIQKSVTVFRQFPSESPQLLLDQAQAAQAVTQVVQNAAEAMDRGGEIHLILKRQPAEGCTWWNLEVRDNGPGVAPHLGERVFEPFLSTGSRQLGLGLSNVMRIMKLHRGSASLSSVPQGGTVVTLKFPETAEPRES